MPTFDITRRFRMKLKECLENQKHLDEQKTEKPKTKAKPKTKSPFKVLANIEGHGKLSALELAAKGLILALGEKSVFILGATLRDIEMSNPVRLLNINNDVKIIKIGQRGVVILIGKEITYLPEVHLFNTGDEKNTVGIH